MDIPNAYLGYLLECWRSGNLQLQVPLLPFHPYDPVWRKQAAEMSAAMYSDPDAAEAQFRFILGVEYSVIRRDNDAGLFPGYLIGWNNRYAIAIISGTSNPAQFVTQAFQLLASPTNFGDYKTLPVWNEVALDFAAIFLRNGINPIYLFAIVGHSYGAAITQVLANIMSRNRGGPTIFQLTFGCPPAGLLAAPRRYVRRIVAADIVNVGDPISALPPPEPYLTWLYPIIGNDTYRAWKDWKPTYGVLRLEGNGSINYDDVPTVDFLTVAAYAVAAISHLPVILPATHLMPTYVTRLPDA